MWGKELKHSRVGKFFDISKQLRLVIELGVHSIIQVFKRINGVEKIWKPLA